MKDELLEEFKDVFDDGENLKTMAGPPMKIHLKDNSMPSRISTSRPIPFAQRGKVRAKLEDMVKKEIIAPLGDQPTQWCHPMVVVPKANDDVRICIDLTKLND